MRQRWNLQGLPWSEGNGASSDEELSSIEDDELCLIDDVQVDHHGAGELAGGKVRLQPYIVPLRHGQLGEPRLSLELLHVLCWNWLLRE